jgi:hypothetical protein
LCLSVEVGYYTVTNGNKGGYWNSVERRL